MRLFLEHGREIFGNNTDDIIRDANFVDAKSAADWWFNTRNKSPYDWGNDIPVSVCQWPLAWFEYKLPTGRIGMLLHQIEVDAKDADEWLITDKAIRYENDSPSRPRRTEAINQALMDGIKLRWVQFAHMVSNTGQKFYTWRTVKYIDEQGDRIAGLNAGLYPPHPSLSMEEIQVQSWQLQAPFWFAISLLHCKNVKLEDVAVPPKVQAKREKRGVPNITFKTLVVEPMRQQVRHEAAEDPTGEQNHIKRALHIARGHFKDYRNGPGLFGKYQGLYWWDMHVRGSADAGVVVKNYQVER